MTEQQRRVATAAHQTGNRLLVSGFDFDFFDGARGACCSDDEREHRGQNVIGSNWMGHDDVRVCGIRDKSTMTKMRGQLTEAGAVRITGV